MARYVAQVPVRWTDQDSNRHVNNGKAVTLLEEARIQLLHDEAASGGVAGFAGGLVVAGLNVEYRRQIPYRARTLRVAMEVDEVRAASFRIGYRMHDGAGEDDPVAVHAWTRMVTFDMDAQRPRRLTEAEREFLGRWAA
ncbi:thioesterase [Pseudonocardia sp. CNS-139]|nr:thioesterase [Pseudonocardia sp. CNS-139]